MKMKSCVPASSLDQATIGGNCIFSLQWFAIETWLSGILLLIAVECTEHWANVVPGGKLCLNAAVKLL